MRRETDLAARYGGEELVLLLPDTDAAGAERVARTALDAVRALALQHGASDVANIVTLSLGVAAVFPDGERGPEMLVELADQALYQAKSDGRNRYVA